jgi:heat shock protein HspQ
MQLVSFTIGDVVQYILQPFLGVYVVEFATGKKAVEHCRAFGPLV